MILFPSFARVRMVPVLKNMGTIVFLWAWNRSTLPHLDPGLIVLSLRDRLHPQIMGPMSAVNKNIRARGGVQGFYNQMQTGSFLEMHNSEIVRIAPDDPERLFEKDDIRQTKDLSKDNLNFVRLFCR